MSTLTLDHNGNALVLKTPYDAGFVAELKTRIPPGDRQFVRENRTWRIDPAHGATVAALVKAHLGETMAVPVSTSLSNSTTRLLDVRYIGATKDRGGDQRTAFGWADGGWSIIFPEPTLRAWFDAPARPDEEVTLYQVLSIKRDASPDDIKKAYRRLARQWHPDVCREPGAAEVFKAIHNAYTLLSDPMKRARYEAGLALAATLQAQERRDETYLTSYRSPLRCGLIMADGRDRLGRFVVSSILAWEDITNEYGQTLSTSWPLGADTPLEVWA